MSIKIFFRVNTSLPTTKLVRLVTISQTVRHLIVRNSGGVIRGGTKGIRKISLAKCPVEAALRFFPATCHA